MVRDKSLLIRYFILLFLIKSYLDAANGVWVSTHVAMTMMVPSMSPGDEGLQVLDSSYIAERVKARAEAFLSLLPTSTSFGILLKTIVQTSWNGCLNVI